jgi:predicted lysophospholipase L1 biosynthesis ABC-type transport system permease subunit
MTDTKEHLQALTDIRSMMERSSRFISLSGLSGVFAGIFALCGAYVAYLKLSLFETGYSALQGGSSDNVIAYLLVDASCVLIVSITVGVLLTMRISKKKEIKFWDATSKRLLINLLIPLITGGLFCLVLLYHGLIGLVAPVTLIFYGLSLINASKYTLNDIRYLGFCEVALGLLASVYIGYGLFFWAAGFGVLHIVYGAVMYFKYERE